MCPKCVCFGKSLMVNFLSSSEKKKLHIMYIQQSSQGRQPINESQNIQCRNTELGIWRQIDIYHKVFKNDETDTIFLHPCFYFRYVLHTYECIQYSHRSLMCIMYLNTLFPAFLVRFFFVICTVNSLNGFFFGISLSQKKIKLNF